MTTSFPNHHRECHAPNPWQHFPNQELLINGEQRPKRRAKHGGRLIIVLAKRVEADRVRENSLTLAAAAPEN